MQTFYATAQVTTCERRNLQITQQVLIKERSDDGLTFETSVNNVNKWFVDASATSPSYTSGGMGGSGGMDYPQLEFSPSATASWRPCGPVSNFEQL